jgi:hypothetical protein
MLRLCFGPKIENPFVFLFWGFGLEVKVDLVGVGYGLGDPVEIEEIGSEVNFGVEAMAENGDS